MDINNKDIIDATNSLVNAALGGKPQPVDDKLKYRPQSFVTVRETATKEDFESLKVGLSKASQPIVFEDGTTVETYEHKQNTLAAIKEAEEMQRKLREQYEKDKAFFEANVIKKARTAGQIEEDYIKVLHPTYRKRFLDGVAQYGTLAAACRYMKINYDMVIRGDVLHRMLTLIPSFKQEVDDALNEYQAELQMEMHRRAVEGIDKGIYHNGERIATEKVYSDSLLAKMVDTYIPEYKEVKQKENSRGNIVNVQIIKDFHNYKDN